MEKKLPDLNFLNHLRSKIKDLTVKKAIAAAVVFLAASCFGLQAQTVTTFSYTGGAQSFTVPSCVATITIFASGAQGGASAYPGANGGSAQGILAVTAGQVFNIFVGGQGSLTAGGYNGGASGGISITSSGAGGGGGTDVRFGGIALTDRILAAGGGGGGGGTSTAGGSYGATAGTGGGGTSCSTPIGYGGGGGSGCTGVLGGPGGCAGSTATGYGTGGAGAGVNGGGGISGSGTGGFGAAGALGLGGAGGSYNTGTFANGAGGGGGGYYGGAGGMSGSGGCNGGGGGGSSYVGNSFTSPTFTAGNRTGNGIVVISYFYNGTGVSALASPTAICTGGTANITGSGVVTYTWLPVGSFPGSNNSTLTLSPTVNTTYTVQGTNSLGCLSTYIFTIPVDQGVPTLTVSNSATSGGICPNSTVALTASGATTYTWTGGSSTVTNGVVFSPTLASGYTVTGGNACGTSTAATSVSVHPFPTITPVASSASLCSGTNLTLTGVGNATAYVWSGWTSAITNGVGFAPATTATYTVIGTSALSCTASATVPVTVVTTPLNFPTQNTGIICIGGSSTLTATGATSYTWASATQTVFTSTFVVTPNIGTTTYTVTKANATCFDTKTISVVTNSLPTIFAIVNPTLVCALNPATLAVGGGQSYTWTAPGTPNFTFTGATPVVSPPVSSIYTVAASDGTCISTTTVFLAANPNPTITTTVSSPSICAGHSVTLNANGGINYTWTASTGTFYTQSVTDAPTIATAYNVSGDNSFGCITGASTVVLVNPNPVITTSASKILVCSGNPSTLYASGANTYTWDANANGAFTSSTIVNPTSPTSAVMIYTVQGSNSFPCQSSQTVQVAVFVPTLAVTGNTNTCYGGNIQLNASGGNINTYAWYTTIGGSPYSFQTLNTTVTAAAVYTVNAMTSTLSVVCPATQTVSVGVYYNPTITAMPQRTLICNKESVDLYGDGGVSYSWSNGTPGGTITVSPTNNTTYTVTGTDANGCVGTGTVLVKVSGCAGVNELSNANNGLVLYPNPNNGEFTLEANAEITLTLVNELGQIIKAINLSGANNYKVSVNDLAKGIYFISGQKDNVQINQKVIVAK